MNFSLERVLDSKKEFRKKLAQKPISEKLRIVEELAERALATRKDTSQPLPDQPWSIPSHWRWAHMGEVAEVIGGGTPKSDEPAYFGGEIPWITPADLSGYTRKTIDRGRRNITQTGIENSGARLLPRGAVLFSSRAPIGYVAIADQTLATNQGFKSFVLKEALLPDFVYYYLQRARGLALALASGTTFLEISGKNAARLPIPVPPLDDQRRIVAEIEKQFTRLEAGVAALRRMQANLKRYRAAVLQTACEGRLVPTEAELARAEGRPFESGQQLLARILTERRKNWQGRGQYKEPAAPNTANLPLIPEGWAWAALEAVSEAVGGFAFSSTRFVNEGYQVVKMANIRMGKIDLTQKPSFISDVTSDIIEKSSLREGDLVVTLTGTRKKRDYGYVAVVKNQDGLLLNQRIARVRPFAGMDSKFLQLAMQTEDYRDRFFSHETGNVGQGNVGMAAVTKEVIAFPPLAEQTRIVAEVERRLSVVEELEAVVTTNLQRATRLRQAVLQRAFNGEL